MFDNREGPGCWAVVPAAGKGRRFGAEQPKQYHRIGGKTVLEHTLERLSSHPAIEGVVVAVSSEDDEWGRLPIAGDARILSAPGGTERCHSVTNALAVLAVRARPDDWVLVHDAARPCLRHADIDRLLETLARHTAGGLLSVPVADTLKRCDDGGTVQETVSRERLWRALTPQMFRLGPLSQALARAIEAGYLVTDEASAMEYCGYSPRIVQGHADNIKITHPQDLQLAELYLAQQAKERT